MKKRLTMFLASLVLFVGGALAQTQVNGTVLSQEDGQPIIGAAVRVEGSKVGMLTDVNGRFSLQLPAGKTQVTVSYLGYEPKTVAAKNGMRVFLKQDASALDEVIVVAYGTAKKSAFTGSAATVSAENLSKHITTNVADALVGSVSGLQMRGASGQPGSDAGKINIRGIASMYADTDPLIIVDGAPYDASLSNIPQGDIESISVLKDAASAALYGARGAAGVIIITTKKGKTQDAVVNVDMKWGVNSRSIPDYDVFTNPGEYYEAYYKQLYNYGYYSQGMTAERANLWANQTMVNQLAYLVYDTPTFKDAKGNTVTDASGNPIYNLVGMDGRLNPAAKLGRSYTYYVPDPNDPTGKTMIPQQGFYLTPDDWVDEAYRNALRQEYNVSVSGGNSRSSFYASASYLDEDGIIKPYSYKRFTTRIKADYQAREWLKVGANIGFVRSNSNSDSNNDGTLGSTNVMYFTSNIAPIYPVYVRGMQLDADGNPTGQPYILNDDRGYQSYDFGTQYLGNRVRPFLASGNPIGTNNLNAMKSTGNQFNGTFTIDVDLTKDLKFNSTNNLNFGQTSYSAYQNPFYGPKAGVNGEIEKYQSNTFRQTYTQTLNYGHQFGLHGISAILGHEWYKTETKYLNAKRTGGFSPDIQEINAFATMSGSNSYTSAYNVEGYFGNAQYNYDEKYFASASYRRDATSRFHKDHRWGSFWSVGAAWLISKEKFFNVSWVDQLKLKASIGQQGNDNIGSWAYTDLYSISKATDTDMSPAFYRVGNQDITWETTTNFNVGIEFAVLKNRLTGSFDFYNKKTTDLLFWLSIPEAMGSRGYYGNLGDIRNTGIELVLSGDVVRTKNLVWNVTANIAHNSTKILKLPETKTASYGGFAETGNNIQLWYEEDGSLYTPFLRSFAGLNEKGEALYWYDEDLSPAGGKVDETGSPITNNISKAATKRSGTTTNYSEASRYAFDTLLPDFTGGFSTTLTAYGFDVSASFDYQIGGQVYDYRYQALMGNVTGASDVNGGNYHKDILNAWTPNNTETNIPRFQYMDQYANSSSDRWLTDAGYLNFQSFTVGYSLPKSLISKLQLSKLRVYVSGENIKLWSARKGLDPRYSFEGSEYINNYAPARNITGGVQVTF